MKKILTMLLAVFVIYNLSAQPQVSTTGIPYQFAKSWPPGIKIFSVDDDGFTGILYPRYGNRKEMGKDGMNAALIHVNDDISSMTKTTFKIPLEYTYITSFENDDEVISLYFSYDKKSSEFVLYKFHLNKSANQLTFDPERLAGFELSMRDGKTYYLAHSEDNTKHSLTLMINNRKQEFTGLYTMLMDEKGEVLWGSTQMPSFSGQTYEIEDVAVTNDGEVLLGVRSCKLNPRGTHSSNENIHLVMITEEGLHMVTQPLSFGVVKDMGIKLMANGNLFFGGYYSEEYKDPATGVFSVIFDRENKEFQEFSNRHLGSLVEDDKRVSVFGNRQRNSKFLPVCRYIHELDNGNMVIMGEQAFVIQVIDERGRVSYSYHRKDIFCHYFNQDGEEITTYAIPKYQISATPGYTTDISSLGISYYSFQKDNEVYVIFNDNSDNYAGKSKDVKIFLYNAKGKKNCTVLAKVSEDSRPETKVINRYDNTSLIFHRLVQNTESQAILSFVKKKELMLHKLTF